MADEDYGRISISSTLFLALWGAGQLGVVGLQDMVNIT